MGMYLDISDHQKLMVYIFMHNKNQGRTLLSNTHKQCRICMLLQMFVPNLVELYGSQVALPQNRGIDVWRKECYDYDMKITKSHLKALDQPSERCDSSTTNPNTSECIARYIGDKIGCNMKIHGGKNKTDMPPCRLLSELNALKNISRHMQEANANTIYELTGCLASCERNEYAKIDGYLTKKYCQSPYLHLQFIIASGSYEEKEQYIIYDFNSFIGSIGGILGLCNLTCMALLGCGVLNLHNGVANLLGRIKKHNNQIS